MAIGAGDLFNPNTNVQNPMIGVGPFASGGLPNAPSFGGQNQWMSYPGLPNFGTGTGGSSGGAPPFSGAAFSTTIDPATGRFTGAGGPGKYFPNTPGGVSNLGGGISTAPTFDPAFTSQFYQMLSGLMGGGENLQSELLNFLGGGASNIPGASSLAQLAQTGNPISTLPEWQAMLAAQQRNIGENEANLKEQFGFAGDLSSSPFGTAITDYLTQTTKDQNALLAQMQTTALENAQQRELAASQDITGMAGAESQFLNQLFSGAATAGPSLFGKQQSNLLGGIGSILGGAGAGLSGLADLGLAI